MKLPKYLWHKPSNRGLVRFPPLWGKTPVYLAGRYNSPESLADYAAKCAEITKYLAQQAAERLYETPKKKNATVQIVADLMADYLDYAEGYFFNKPEEFKEVKRALKFMVPFEEYFIEDFGPLALDQVRNAMILKKQARSTINKRINKIIKMYRWGVSREMFPVSILNSLSTLQPIGSNQPLVKEAKKVDPVEWNEVKKLLPYLSNTVKAMIEIHFLAGMRSDEVCRMSNENIEKPKGKNVWLYKLEKHKTDRFAGEKIICLGPKAIEILKPFIKLHPTGYLFRPEDTLDQKKLRRLNGSKKKRPRDKLRKPRRVNDRYSSGTYAGAIKNAFRMLASDSGYQAAKGRMKMNRTHAKNAGLHYWHLHQLRHSRATITNNDLGTEASSAQLGHSIKVNAVYSERNLRLAMEVAEKTG